MTDKAARRVAAAASRLSRRQAEHVARPVERAIIRSLNPLSAELVRGGVLEEGQGLSLSADLRRFDQQLGLAVGDTIAVAELDDGEFLALAGETDREVEHWTDDRSIGLPPGGDTGQVLAKQSPDDYDVYWWSIPPLDADAVAGVGGILYNFENIGPVEGSWLQIQTTANAGGPAWNDTDAVLNFGLDGFHVNIGGGGDFIFSGGHDFIFYAPNALSGFAGGAFSGEADFLTYLGGGDFITYTQGGEVLFYVLSEDNTEGNSFIVYSDGTRYGGDQLFYPGTGDWLVLPYKGPGVDPFETAAPALQLFAQYSPLGVAAGSFTVSQTGDDTFDFNVQDFLGAYLHGGYMDIATTESGGAFGAGINLSSDTSIYGKALETLTLLSFDTAGLGSIGGLLALSGEFGITYDIGDGVEHHFFSSDAGDLLRLYSDGSSFGLPPRGGSPGEILVKASAGTYDMEWASLGAIGGIRFNTDPQADDYLVVHTTGAGPFHGSVLTAGVPPSGVGISLYATDETGDGGIWMKDESSSGIGFISGVVGGPSGGIYSTVFGGGGYYVDEYGGGGIGLHERDGGGIGIREDGGGGIAIQQFGPGGSVILNTWGTTSSNGGDIRVNAHDGGTVFLFSEDDGVESESEYVYVEAHGVGPVTLYPVLFDVTTDGNFNTGPDNTPSPAFAMRGGLGIQVNAGEETGSYVGLTVDIDADDSGCTIDAITLYIREPGGTIIGRHDDMRVQGGTYAAGRKGYYASSGDAVSLYADDVTVVGNDASSVGGYRVSVEAGDSADVIGVSVNAEGGDVGTMIGGDFGASATGSSSYAYGVRSAAGGFGGATAFSGLFGPGNFRVDLGASEDTTFAFDGSGDFQVQEARQVYLYTDSGPYLLLDSTADVAFLYSSDALNLESAGDMTFNGNKIGFFGAGAVSQPATPVTLGDVIAAGQALGLWA